MRMLTESQDDLKQENSFRKVPLHNIVLSQSKILISNNDYELLDCS